MNVLQAEMWKYLIKYSCLGWFRIKRIGVIVIFDFKLKLVHAKN